ncbi:MAG: sulfurtransferase [Anaerolineaceae bacterium]
MDYETIISCTDLLANLSNDNWVIVDCRFDLAHPDWGEEEYRELHIPGAVYANIDSDLSGAKTPHTGRHPLPDPSDFKKAMARLGINESSQVIVYDATSGSYAARLWFLLKFYGHSKVAVLDGGFSEWMKQGHKIETGKAANTRKQFTGSPHLDWIVTTSEIEQNLTNPNWLLIDARAPERYSGKQETIDPVAGHIPGAINRYYGLNLDHAGLFLSPSILRSQFLSLTEGFSPENTVIYCGSGVTSSHHLVAMAIAGLPQPRLYNGSWSEWIRNPQHQIIQKETSW